MAVILIGDTWLVKQPSPKNSSGIWFFRNLWWLLPAAFLVLVLPCGCSGGIFWRVIGSLKSSKPCQIALLQGF